MLGIFEDNLKNDDHNGWLQMKHELEMEWKWTAEKQ